MSVDTSAVALRSYQKRLQIDRNDLDGELVIQAQVMFEVSEALTWAKAERDAIKQEMDEEAGIIKAQLFQEEPKLAGTKADALVKKDEGYMEIRKEKSEKDRIVGQWEAMVEAWKSRGYMLRQLADLYVANYYSPTSAGESSSEKRHKRRERDERSQRRNRRS